jgi:UDP-N-acetylglucosamine 2-epimerase (non-hydrolysing)
MVVLGTRPEAIKMAPVVRALHHHPGTTPIVVSTGQHREMLDQVLDLFCIIPDIDLQVMQHRQELHKITSKIMTGTTEAIAEFKPDAMVVQGDTTTAMAAGLTALYEQVPVVHVEAGLRSGDMANPFPEEANRRLVGVLAALHLAPTAQARVNLLHDGVEDSQIVVTGNTVIDALLWGTALDSPWEDTALEILDRDDRKMVLVTAHRRESWGAPMRGIGRALAGIARCQPDVLIVVPIHRNPAVREALVPQFDGLDNIIVTEPAGYGSFCRLLKRCHLVVTDSGGVQEEAPSLGKPVLVMRDVTERTEGVMAGTARLVGTDVDRIRNSVLELLNNQFAYDQMASVANPYGDGRAAERSVSAIAHLLGRGPRAVPFDPSGPPALCAPAGSSFAI